VVCGLIAFYRELGPKTISGMQHAASGLLVGAVAFELCGSVEVHGALEKGIIFLGFFCGVAFLMILGRFEFIRLTKCYGKKEPKVQHMPVTSSEAEMGILRTETAIDIQKDQSSDELKNVPVPMGLIAGVLIDGTIDGLLIGLNFSINVKAGLLIALALSFEMCLLGLSTVVTLKTTVLPRWGVFILNTILPLPILGAGLIAAALLSGLTGTPYQFIIALGIGALLFLVAEELLIKAHEEEATDTWYVTSLFYGGFLFVLALEILE